MGEMGRFGSGVLALVTLMGAAGPASALTSDRAAASRPASELERIADRLTDEIGRLAAALERKRAGMPLRTFAPPLVARPKAPVQEIALRHCKEPNPRDRGLCQMAAEVRRLREEWRAALRDHALREAARRAEEETRRAAVEAEARRAREEAERRRLQEERRRLASADAFLQRDPSDAIRVAARIVERRRAAAEAEALREAAEKEARRIIEEALLAIRR
jgi:hypothetical protein